MSLVNDKLSSAERAQVLRDAGFDINKDRGQISGIKNIAYDDTQPDLCINLDSGKVNDFGDPTYSGDIFTLLSKTLNKDFRGVVQYIERSIGRSLSDDLDGRNQAGALYGGTGESSRKSKKNNSGGSKKTEQRIQFWTSKKWEAMKKCHEVLKNRGIPDQMKFIEEYDGIGLQALLNMNCGIYGFGDFEFGQTKYDYNKDLYFVFPYFSGAMLYRRTEDGKDVKHIKGSSVKESMFGIQKDDEDNNVLFIMKSPRECMNFSMYCTDWMVAGLVSGENVREFSAKQKEQILQAIKIGETEIYVMLDCDTPGSYENSLIVCNTLNEFLKQKATINLVNLHRHSEGKFKDFTDMVQYSMKKKEWDTKTEDFTKLADKPATILIKSIMEAEVI